MYVQQGYLFSVQTLVLGIAGGTTIRDLNCERLKLSKALYGMGMKVVLQSRCFVKMQECSMLWKWIGTPCPYKGKIGLEAAEAWANDPKTRPDYEKWLKKKII